VVNDKVEATIHPRSPRGYVVHCEQCGTDLYQAMFYDVAERFAELHEDAKGHDTEIEEVTKDA
jgi:hypothetical protein